jgi:NAD(P)-dependent dehydrogenase (short-subunit alcohol dehydrogenase family)
MKRCFRGRAVIVTGAGGGLGRAIALAFAAAGARIAALDSDADAARALAAELAAAGHEAIALACDVSDSAACERAIAAAVERFGAVDLLVANAGITHRSAFAATRPEVIRRVMEVNFFGAVHCTQAALPQLRARRGAIVVISSVAGFAPLVARTGYAASKHALHGFFESLRTELAPEGVDIVMVCPSFVATGIDRHALGADGQPARHAQQVIGRRAQPADVARQVLRAAAHGQRLRLVGATAHMAWWASRIAPAWYERQMARRLRGELTADGGG